MARGNHSFEESLHRQRCMAYVACPFCGAAAGEKCRGVRGQNRYALHTERWQLFDPGHVAAKAVRKEKPMREVAPTDEYPENKDGVTCPHCGEPSLYWQDTWDAAGQRRPKLFEGGKPHVCKPSADDFEDLTK